LPRRSLEQIQKTPSHCILVYTNVPLFPLTPEGLSFSETLKPDNVRSTGHSRRTPLRNR
jgi:hypothetical protein